MIARCPQCQARYRIAREKIGARGARIRCARCETVFKVEAPEARPVEEAVPEKASPEAAGPVARVIVAEGDAVAAKAISVFLEARQIESVIVLDGGDALLRIHRSHPDGVILGGQLSGLGGAAIAEIVRRTAELAGVKLIRVVTLDEPLAAPEFEAAHTLEPGDLPEGLGPILERMGLGRSPVAQEPAAEAQVPSPEPQASPTRARRRRGPPTSSDPEIAAAERLARIIVSDIILYNDEKFTRATAAGDVASVLAPELEEARALFEQRIPEEVRSRRSFLVEELERRAAAKRG